MGQQGGQHKTVYFRLFLTSVEKSERIRIKNLEAAQFENGLNCKFQRNIESDQEALAAVQERENRKEKHQIKHNKDLYINSPGFADSFHSPTTSTCRKFLSESRCWLENVDHIPNRNAFLNQKPPVEGKGFSLGLGMR